MQDKTQKKKKIRGPDSILFQLELLGVTQTSYFGKKTLQYPELHPT